jgi:hypothetical protein
MTMKIKIFWDVISYTNIIEEPSAYIISVEK